MDEDEDAKRPRIDRLLHQLSTRGERRDLVTRIYIGWDHKTDGFEEALKKRLQPDIDETRVALVDHLEEADLYTPLVCAGNLASPEFWDELEKALGFTGQLCILPIWLFPITGVHPLMPILASFPGVPWRYRSWSEAPDREEAWTEIVRGIHYAAARLVDYRNVSDPRCGARRAGG